jgi:hypothetical protein
VDGVLPPRSAAFMQATNLSRLSAVGEEQPPFLPQTHGVAQIAPESGWDCHFEGLIVLGCRKFSSRLANVPPYETPHVPCLPQETISMICYLYPRSRLSLSML